MHWTDDLGLARAKERRKTRYYVPPEAVTRPEGAVCLSRGGRWRMAHEFMGTKQVCLYCYERKRG